MKLKLNDLLSRSGTISRAPFLVWAAILFALKYNLDRLLFYWGFNRSWSIFSYFDQPLPGIRDLSPVQSPKEFVALLVLSLPFLWAGVILCIKRLRSAQLPLWLAVLFVVPIVKWILFVVLALVPERGTGADEPASAARWLPKSVFGSAALAVGMSVLFSIAAALVSTWALRSYSWGLFVGIPFCMGFFAALIYGAGQPRRVTESLTVATASVVIAGAAMLAVAFEGVICLVMAFPLAFVLALIGALAAHAIQAGRRSRTPPQVFCVPLLAVPFMFASESLTPRPAPSLTVVTALEINAPATIVWEYVVEFAELPPPKEWIFKLGIAYPIRAEIKGHGHGAVRNCIFSTGPFVEPIEVWDEPKLLKFSVKNNPAPLDEWTPYHEIHPPHLKGFLISEQGQFRLIPLSERRTLLEGTTWYRHNMWPVSYWQIWSDQIIHTIHRRVLRHIKALSESDQRGESTAKLSSARTARADRVPTRDKPLSP